MKISYIILSAFILVVSLNKRNIEEEFSKHENLGKSVALSLKETKKNSTGKKFELQENSYLKLVPPEYEILFDTIEFYDKSKFHPEMKIFYQVNEEQILLKKGGYKWINESAKIDNCNIEYPYKPLAKKEKLLMFIKEPDEYGLRTILSLNIAPVHSTKTDWKRRGKMNQKASKLSKEGYFKQVIKREIIKKNGYIKRYLIKDFRKIYNSDDEFILLEKGCYNISSAKSKFLNCEPNLVNIQMTLKSLGYQTNIDGKETIQYKLAKQLFIKEKGIDYNENSFIKELGFR